MRRMEAWRTRLLLNVALGLPLLAVVGVAGYAWKRWLGLTLALIAILAFRVLYRFSHELRGRGAGPAARASDCRSGCRIWLRDQWLVRIDLRRPLYVGAVVVRVPQWRADAPA